MEMDLLVGQSTLESLEKNRSQMEVAVRDVQLVTLLASSEYGAMYHRISRVVSHAVELANKDTLKRRQ